MKIIKIVLFFGLMTHFTLGHAYSDDGHKIVAKLAWQKLSPYARQNIERILGVGESEFIKAATWADEVKGDDRYRDLKPLHYVNMPKNQSQYDRKRDCRKDQCVVQAISDFSLMARDQDEKKAKLAVRMLVHLIGDIHQPMHAGLKEDRGGNWYRIKYQGDNINLHKLWDHQLVDRIDSDWQKAAAMLSYPEAADVLGPVQWAEESHRLAMSVAYAIDEGQSVTEDYLVKADAVSRERLALAGWRLAMWLNKLW